MLSYAEIKRRFTYVPPKDPETARKLKDMEATAIEFVSYLVATCPESRELSLAISNFEQTMHWAKAAVAHPPVQEGG